MARKSAATAEKPVNYGEEVAGDTVVDEVIAHLNGNGKTVDATEDDLPPEFLDIGLGEAGDGGAPKAEFVIPEEEEFTAQQERDFMLSADLRDAATAMIESPEFPELVHLQDLRMVFAWKRQGGMSKGDPNRGGIVRGNTLLRMLGSTDFVVWLAADYCRDRILTFQERDALLYHFLCGCQVDEHGKPFVKGPDLVMYEGELERFGPWSTKLKRAVRQMAPFYEQAGLEL
jgi:hypothetical protein